MAWNMGGLARGIKALTLMGLMTLAQPAHAATVIAAFGDSLTAGYGLAAEQAFPVQLEKALKDKGYDVRVINMGVSGDTTTGGLARVDWALKEKPDVVILELGANDMLRGTDPALTRRNLEAIIAGFRNSGAKVLLAGMKAAPNLGPVYKGAFDAIYPDLADKYDIPLYPFFLESVAAIPALNQADGVHPKAEGVTLIVQHILPEVEKLLK